MNNNNFITDVLRAVSRELAPNIKILFIFLLIAQVIFFTYGLRLIPPITKFGLFLFNIGTAVLIPYSLAMLVKAVGLAKKEFSKSRKKPRKRKR